MSIEKQPQKSMILHLLINFLSRKIMPLICSFQINGIGIDNIAKKLLKSIQEGYLLRRTEWLRLM